MTPVIKHLHKLFAGFPGYTEPGVNDWTFAQKLTKLGPDFYARVLPLHPLLHLEYSIICTQLRHELSPARQLTREQLIARLNNALVLAQVLEHIHQHYLIVPREIKRLRNQQRVYLQLLTQLDVKHFIQIPEPVDVEASFSQRLRESTGMTNWYRMITMRSKRVLNFLDQVGTGWPTFSDSVAVLDKYANPILAHLSWFFFLPRMLVNLFLLLKHTLPGPWMGNNESAAAWQLRLQAQLQRRWFELANDVLWFALGLVNCFIFFGPLAPIGVCLNLVGFVLDVVISAARVYIELNRLSQLYDAYEQLTLDPANKADLDTIRDYQAYILQRRQYEQLRLYLHLGNTSGVLLAMCLAIPVLIVNPMFPLIGAILLVAIWGVSFTLTRKLEEHRPNDVLDPVLANSLNVKNYPTVDGEQDNTHAVVRVTDESSNEHFSASSSLGCDTQFSNASSSSTETIVQESPPVANRTISRRHSLGFFAPSSNASSHAGGLRTKEASLVASSSVP